MNRRSLIHALIVFVIGAVLTGGYVLFFNATTVAKREAQALAAEINKKTREHEQVGGLRDTLLSIEREEAQMQTHFVSVDGIVPFLEDVEATGRSLGVSVNVVSVSDPDKNGRIGLSLSLSGTFDAVVRTIGVLEYAERVAAVRTVTLDVEEGSMWNAAVTLIVLTPPSP